MSKETSQACSHCTDLKLPEDQEKYTMNEEVS